MDLLYHFIAGAVISLAVILLAKNTKDKTVAVAVALSLGAGVFKEVIIDMWLRQTSPEVADITLTWTGGMLILFIIKFVELFKKP
jgi:hypothetical protein